MPTIQRRVAADGKTSYRAMVRLRGYPAQSATFRRKTDAKRWSESTEAAIREGRHFAKSEAQKRVLRELVLRYTNRLPRKDRGAGGNRRFLDLAKGEQENRIGQLDWWTDRIGDFALAQVTPPLIADLRDRLSVGGTRSRKRRY